MSDQLVAIDAPAERPQLAEHVPAPMRSTPRARARTVTEIAAGGVTGESSGLGRGAEHGTRVHAAVAALIHHYSQNPETTIDGLVAELATYPVDDAVRAAAEEILRLPTLTTAVGDERRIEAEYPVAGVIDGELVYGVVDLLIEQADGSLLVADLKTDHQGEQDPTGTPYRRQLDIYAELAGAQSTRLLGPTPSG